MTARDTLTPIQMALYDRLSAVLAVPVLDHVPEGTPRPYVVIGEAYATPRNSQDRYGRRTAATIHVWSDHLGFSEVNQITDQIIQAVDHQSLTVVGHDVVLANFEFQQTIQDPDPDIRHAVVRLGLTTEQES